MLTGKISNLKSYLYKVSIPAIILLFVIVSSLAIYSPLIPKNITLEIGSIAEKTINSPKYIEYESKRDKKINQGYIEDVKSKIETVYSINTNINDDVIKNIDAFFNELFSSPIQTLSIHVTQILSQEDVEFVQSLDKQRLGKIRFYTLSTVRRLLNAGIKEKNNETISKEINTSLQNYSTKIQQLMFKIVSHFLKANLTLDIKQTNLLVSQALSSINYQKTIYKEGQPIIYENELVKEDHIEVFKALNIYQSKAKILPFIGILFTTAFCILVLYQFIFTFYRRIHHFKYYSLILVCVLLIILLSRLILSLTILPPLSLTYLIIPISILSMVLSILITPNISLIVGTLTSILITFMYSFSFEVFIFLFLSNCFATFKIFNTFKRSELISTGYFIGLANICVVLGIGLITEQTHFLWYGINAISAFSNGVISSMITLAILPYFESFFRLTTNQSLMELSNLNHPLLKRLMTNAPGTYQHSLMVATLAEAAADAIQANSVLCRVGSYFHDIGKLKRPLFFSENQFSKENPHNQIAPRISKIIIISHVKEAYEMGKKSNLPTVILDMILQHHGTSLLSLFFNQALNSEKDSETVDNEFRYPGPKPQTKESGILMLADSVEASTRSLEKATPQKIENTINKIFKEKLDDQQLSECPLSFKEISIIKQTFLNLFKGMSHSRVDYQKEIEKIKKIHEKIS